MSHTTYHRMHDVLRFRSKRQISDPLIFWREYKEFTRYLLCILVVRKNQNNLTSLSWHS